MKNFNKKIQDRFAEMQATGKLFRVELTGNQVWDLYLSSFPGEYDPKFRDPNSSTHNCNHCKNFIRRYGNIVAVDNEYNIISMFDVDVEGEYYESSIKLSNAIRSSKIKEVFFETFNELKSLPYESCNKNNSVFRLGTALNSKRYTKEEAEKYGVVKANEIRSFNHFHLDLNKSYVDFSGSSVEALMGEYRDSKNVFQRAMETIPVDTLNLVRDLINQGSLLNGQTHLFKIEQFLPFKIEYDNLSPSKRDAWCWIKSYKLPIAKFRNELIGVLCTELAEGEELNKACQSWNKRVDPANYMKAIAPITKKQIEEAKKFVEENGYVDSFDRRFATIDDIKVSEILHSNIGDSKLKNVSIFDNVKATSTRHKRNEFDGVEEIHIEKFMKDILPSCSSIEAFVTNKQKGNFASLTTSNNENSKPIFKWDNNYSWTFNGNLAGKSQIKEAVKSEGGKVDGVLRFSITWNEDGRDILDYDAHAKEPGNNGQHICFRTYKGHNSPMSGMLDVDMIRPRKLGVENIVWSDKSKMKDGVYKFWINNYDNGRSKGVKAEIEFDGEIYTYDIPHVSSDQNVAEVTLKNGEFTIKHIAKLSDESTTSTEIYNLETNKFHKVNLVCLSPNHWNNNNVGNKHYFFMLEGCKTKEPIRGFHNENLLPDLAQHRKVLEVLGTTNTIKPSDKQLSGLGFNATVKDELILRLSGSHKRVVKVLF